MVDPAGDHDHYHSTVFDTGGTQCNGMMVVFICTRACASWPLSL